MDQTPQGAPTTNAHGFQIRILGADGKPELVVFASKRKRPELLGILKKIDEAQRKNERLSLKRQLLRRRLEAVSAGDLVDTSGGVVDAFATDESYANVVAASERILADIEANDNELDAINTKLCDLMWAFFVEGFLGAGFPQGKAEELASRCDPTDFGQIRDRAMSGCGLLDFTKRDTF